MTDLPQPFATQSVPATAELADPVWITARVESLLGHWARFLPKDEPEMTYRMRMADWRDALGDLPQEAVEMACAKWIREAKWMPSPKEIRDLAKSCLFWPQPARSGDPVKVGKPIPVVTGQRAAELASEVFGANVPAHIVSLVEVMKRRDAS